jgi:quercetin dioxygenase-like cupin family protein
MSFIKNIEQEKIIELSKEVIAAPGQVVSKTLVQNSAVSVTLFAFSKGEEISTHSSDGDAMVLVLEGTGRFTIDGKEYFCSSGESIVMPAGKPHAVFAEEDFKMLLTVIFIGSRT